jgi:beta-mannosidase
VDLLDASGAVVASTGYLPGGPARDVDHDIGLQARIEPADESTWLLEISTRRMAEYVQVDVPGFLAADSWFHLPPGGSRTTVLRPEPGPSRPPRGRVRALNSSGTGPVGP